MLTDGRRAILHDLLAPTPGRLGRTLEITIKVAIVVVISMTFQIPDPALSAYIIFFVSKEDSGRSILTSTVFLVAITAVITILFLLYPTSLNHSSVRILFIAAASYVMFFLDKASKLAPLAGTLGLILAAGLNAEQNAPIGEVATRALLYVALLTIFPIAINLVFNIFFGRHPEQSLREGLAARLAVASDAIGGRDADSGKRLQALVAQGNVELATELKMIALFHRLPHDTVGRLKALITLSYALLLTVAVLPAEATTDQMDDIAARTNHLAGLIRSLPDKIDAPATDAPQQGEASVTSEQPGPGATPELPPLQAATVTSMMEEIVAGAPSRISGWSRRRRRRAASSRPTPSQIPTTNVSPSRRPRR